MAKSFVHLHGHTEYSLLDGLSKVKKLVKTVKKFEMPAVAITDHGSMYGAIEFYKECLKENIKPIIGCELYVAKRSHKDKEGKVDTEPYHLTVLAKNYQGYLNLMKLVSIGHLDGYYYKPRVDKQLLKQFSEGLIALSGCPAGEFLRSMKTDDIKSSQEIAQQYLEIFGEGNYFFELQHHEYEPALKSTDLDPKIRRDLQNMMDLREVSKKTIKELSQKLGVRMVATNDFHYVEPDDAAAQDALVCVQTGKFIKDIDRLRMIDVPDLYIRSTDEMSKLFEDIPEAIETSVKIADSIDLEITLAKPYFPIFDIPGGLSADDYLKKRCYEGFEAKFSKDDPIYDTRVERLEYELSIIAKKKYSTYFLIVADFINWAQEHNIITNTRGSAAGSFALFCLNVTNIDPIDFLLPFERFLNPFRPSLPDIDADLADDRRDEVIKYVMEKYGHDRVAHITTFGTMMGRAAVRDVGRVLAMPYGEVDNIAKLIPPPHQGFHKSLEDAILEVPELSTMYKQNTQVKHLLDLSKKVEGTVRHASVHAAGIVIAPGPLTDFTPIQRESKGEKIVTQYDMFAVGEDGVGLVKIDMLGIRNLSILGHSTEIVKQNRKIEVDLDNLPIDDQKTFALLGRGETMGLFQIESEGMRKNLMELKPTNFYDIMAMLALYRPGPMAIIPDYVDRKHHPEKIEFYDPRMKEYLERSLGLLVYQDDVLLTAINIAGYTWEEADKFRKAMGKKIKEEMIKQEEHFIHGCEERGMSHEKAVGLFELIKPFAAYGFNKAHAASYAMITYQTAYMKANFPAEFMAAVMTAEYGDSEKIASAIEECKKMGIVVLPPDVNKSDIGFMIEDETAVRFGLSAIKNVGVLAIESIIEARIKGEFKSLADLCGRVDTRLVNKKALESLIKAGALDSLGPRNAQMQIVEQILELIHLRAKKTLAGQVGLFGEEEQDNSINIKLPEVDEYSVEVMLAFEKELLGFYLHEPIFLQELKSLVNILGKKTSDLTEELVGQRVAFGAVVMDVKRVMTKKSAAEMAFVKFGDGISDIEGVVFPTLFADIKSSLERDKVVGVVGKIDKREDKISVIVDKVKIYDPEGFIAEEFIVANTPKTAKRSYPVSEADPKPKSTQKELAIEVPKGSDVEVLKMVNKTLREFPGSIKVSLILPNGGNNLQKMELPFGVKFNDGMVSQIENILGKGTVRLT